MRKLFFFAGAIFFNTPLFSQTIFWQDNFENATTPDIAAGSTRTPENNSGTGGPPNTSYFKRTNGSDISLIGGAFTSFTNTFFWAGEDHDTPFGAGNEEQQIEWTGINISGKTNLTFKGLFGANSTNGSWDNFNTGSGAPGFGVFASPSNDYIIVQYAIDAGAYANLISFFGDDLAGGPGVAKKLKEDTNGDFIGDGTTLNQAMTEFTKTIPGTGSVLKLRIRVFSNGGSEEWAIDNFRMLSGAVVPVKLTGFTGKNTNTSIQLNWQTENEVNFKRFEVEKGIDGINYLQVGSVAAAGHVTNTYSFEDYTTMTPDKYFYRLKMVDKNGTYSYSPVIFIRQVGFQGVTVYPNPSKERVNINIGGNNSPNNTLTLYDATGRILQKQVFTSLHTTLNISSLKTGIYWLQVNDMPVQKLIRQ